nr:hypothetical protein CFP56_40697 [Quercus suber]
MFLVLATLYCSTTNSLLNSFNKRKPHEQNNQLRPAAMQNRFNRIPKDSGLFQTPNRVTRIATLDSTKT